MAAGNKVVSKGHAFSNKCASLIKQQRARLYILRRCATTLLCWYIHGPRLCVCKLLRPVSMFEVELHEDVRTWAFGFCTAGFPFATTVIFFFLV